MQNKRMLPHVRNTKGRKANGYKGYKGTDFVFRNITKQKITAANKYKKTQ